MTGRKGGMQGIVFFRTEKKKCALNPSLIGLGQEAAQHVARWLENLQNS